MVKMINILEDYKTGFMWALGIVLTVLGTISTFFLKNLYVEFKLLSKNTQTIIVQQSIINTRLTALEADLANNTSKIKEVEEDMANYEKEMLEFYKSQRINSRQ